MNAGQTGEPTYRKIWMVGGWKYVQGRTWPSGKARRENGDAMAGHAWREG